MDSLKVGLAERYIVMIAERLRYLLHTQVMSSQAVSWTFSFIVWSPKLRHIGQVMQITKDGF